MDVCVVKHTFIEVEEYETPDSFERTRVRRHTDSAVYNNAESRCATEFNTEESVESEITGISDTDAGSVGRGGTDTNTSEGEPGFSGPCYQVMAKELPLSVTGASSGAAFEKNSQHSGSSRSRPVEASEGGPPKVKAIEDLLSENARLALENKLLKENAGLAAENASLKTLKSFQEPAPAPPTPTGPAAEVQQCYMAYYGYAPGYPMPMQAAFYASPWDGSNQMSAYEEDAAASGQRRGRRQRGSRGAAAAGEAQADNCVESERTTVMLRNLPNNYTRAMVLAMLDRKGFACKYDFLYLPIDFKTHACLGYAFVNLVSPTMVPEFWRSFDGFSRWALPTKKICGVSWSGPRQGLEAHIERYRNSPVMHPTVPEEFQPVVFEGGKRVPFPQPSKPPRSPRVRN